MLWQGLAVICVLGGVVGEPPLNNQYLPPPGTPPKGGYDYERPSVPFPPPPPPSFRPPTPSRPTYGPPTPTRPTYAPPTPPRPTYGPPTPTRPTYAPPTPPRPTYGPPTPTRPTYAPPTPPRPSYGPPTPTRPTYAPPTPPRPTYGPPVTTRPTYGPPPPTYRPTPGPKPTYGPPTEGGNHLPGQVDGHHDHHDHHHHHEPGMPFDFNYAVKDDYYGTDYSHNAISDGDVVKGQYRVQLPDGRLQIVTYTADWKNGFNADVQYQGQAAFPDRKPGGPAPPGGFTGY